ncbi:MAG: adenylate/guanylate cyclase domain-containing protein [Thermoleophilia bacterium]|nr:adenylate/guanylate cyclase domain-containing protein [Thermoleophilia bacterium]
MAVREETCVRVVLFDDMRGSTALKERLARRSDEEAFHDLRREHDDLVREMVERDGGGEVLKSTGDGVIVVFSRPSIAVERAIEIQERLHEHPHLRVRIGIDMGEVKLRWDGDRPTDVFGLHVDMAARALELASDGHICVTRPVYTDAFSWVTKKKIAWKEHGPHRVKAGDPPLDVFEPYNANLTKPLRKLRGDKVVTGARRRAAPAKAAPAAPAGDVAVIRPWEAVARDGREFAARGAGVMYWFRVPLGGISYPEGFRSFLQPALENDRITKIRFVLDASHEPIRRVWDELVLPLVEEWGGGRPAASSSGDRGRLEVADGKSLAWVFVDLSREFSPCFKLLVSDLDLDEDTESEAQVFLSTAARTVWLRDGTEQAIRVPDAVLRIRPGTNESLLNALNAVANQWDSLFT